MKKIIFFLLVLSINIGYCRASNNITYFYGEPMIVNNSNIEILSNELSIDIINSKINNTFYLKNTSASTISTSFTIPIENKEYSIVANNVEIKLNGTHVDFERNANGDYVVYTKIAAESGKKLEVSYNTDNDLNNAKIIKYDMENFRGKVVGKVNVQIKIDRRNIPLIEKIYPGHFEFDENTNVISVEYYNYEVTPITKEIIVQKETFHNLLYGRETELDDETRKVIQDWSNGVTDKTKLFGETEYYNLQGEIPRYINQYVNKNYYAGIKIGNPILYYLYCYKAQKGDNDEDNFGFPYLANKTICVDFVETEDGIDLYRRYGKKVYEIDYSNEDYFNIVEQGIDYNNMNYSEIENIRKENIKKYFFSGDFDYEGEEGLYKYVYANDYTEREYLKTIGAWASPYGARVIYVGEGINGEKLGATEEEIVKYNNSINADLYMRVMIYDDPVPENEYGYYDGPIIGYYNEENKELALILKNGQYGVYTDGISKLLKNDYIKDNSEIPTIGYFSYYRKYEENKYVLHYVKSYTDGIDSLRNVFDRESVQNLLTQNRNKNNAIKIQAEKLVNELELLDNEKSIQEEINAEKVSLVSEKVSNNNKSIYFIFITSFVVVFSACVVIIIFHTKKKK